MTTPPATSGPAAPPTAAISATRSLADLSHGEVRVLVSVSGERSFRRRLLELGFIPGTPVRMVRNIPIGDVLEVELRTSRVSLRISEARSILVAADAPRSDEQRAGEDAADNRGEPRE